MGMSEDFLKHLFEPFSQEKNTYSSSLNSCGLGLSIAKQLTEQMNGSIEVESQLGEGSKFTVILPVQPVMSLPNVQTEPPAIENSPSEFADMTVLLCEDHPLNAKIAQKLLENRGFTVDVAENGQIGLDKYLHAPDGFYSVILMDIRMPVMDGLEASLSIRQSTKKDSRTIPIIAVTANAFEDEILQTKKAGMNTCVSKPIHPDTLYQVLRQYIFGAKN